MPQLYVSNGIFFFCYVVGGKNWNPENDDENESDTGNTGMYQGK